MGVPAFFRWLSRKYPAIVVHCTEEKPKIINGVKIPVNTEKENPNSVEFDNLYLDMNGIIHPCTHPENKPAPKNEDEMMIAIFEYIDRIFSIVRPRRLLYMAIDGVAPRAKMNQQRSRRFRAAKESAEKVSEVSRVREELKSKGFEVPPEKPKEEHFDSNCITPGTPFMARLAKYLHFYIHDRLNNDPGWRNISVVLSDANVPGEGEHKIMDYIRKQREQPSHDPNTRHCLCGADADLIMLGLATHEPNFTIIREEFKPNMPKPCDLCGQLGHELKECTGAAKPKEEFVMGPPVDQDVEFIFIHLNVLREYLAKELAMPGLSFSFDLERVIDDWVFLCFFVGNDFLPHLPSLEIREGAIDRLVGYYKSAMCRCNDFLTNSGVVDFGAVELIMKDLGDAEDTIFKKRRVDETERQAWQQRKKRGLLEKKKRARLMNDKPAWVPAGQFRPMQIGNSPSPVQNARQEAYQMRMQSTFSGASTSKQSDSDALTTMLKSGNSGENQNSSNSENLDKRKHEDEDEPEEPVDEVRLWEDGWKDRYYASKFEVKEDNIAFRCCVANAYAEGLLWVLQYYYQGCPSWTWYFPYHYAPFASDFASVEVPDNLLSLFDANAEPFKPLEQLMAVFPAASRTHVPEPWAELMIDAESCIIDFYPDDFKIDLNGKKFAWQGVALLPFVDEKRLHKGLGKVYSLLSGEEKKRNVRGDDKLYVRKGHKGFESLANVYEGHKSHCDLSPNGFHGASGRIFPTEIVVEQNGTVHSPIDSLPDLDGNEVVCVDYQNPAYDAGHKFCAARLKNAVDPPKVLKPDQRHIPDNTHQRFHPYGQGNRRVERNMNRNSSPYGQVPPPYQYMRSKNDYSQAGLPLSSVTPRAAVQVSPWQQQQDDDSRSPRGWHPSQSSADRNFRNYDSHHQVSASRWSSSQASDSSQRNDSYHGRSSANYGQHSDSGSWRSMNSSGSSTPRNHWINDPPRNFNNRFDPIRPGMHRRQESDRPDNVHPSTSDRWSSSSNSSYSSYRRR